MRNPSPWSIGLGHWLGIPVRLHVSFVLLAVFALFLTSERPPAGGWSYGLLAVGIWFLAVVLHEAGHCIAAVRLGGEPNRRVVLTPLGDPEEQPIFRDASRELVAAAAGPIANFAACIAGGCLLLAAGDVSLAGLTNPFYPRELVADDPTAVVVLKLIFWTNWVVILINLLPASCTDAGRALRAVLSSFLQSWSATVVVRRASFVTAVLLCLLAWFLRSPPAGIALAAWVPLVTLAAFFTFAAASPLDRGDDEMDEEDLFGYDFSQGYTSLERKVDPAAPPVAGPLRRWFERRRDDRQTRLRKIEEDEERRVDDILTHLHGSGLKSLSAEDRALLNRVSARYRSRSTD